MGQCQGNPFFGTCSTTGEQPVCGILPWGSAEPSLELPKVGDIVKLPESKLGEVVQVEPSRLLPVQVRTLDGRARWYSSVKIEPLVLNGSQEARLRSEIARASQKDEVPESNAYTQAAAQAKDDWLLREPAKNFEAGDDNVPSAGSAQPRPKVPSAVAAPKQPRQQVQSQAQGIIPLLDGFAISQNFSEATPTSTNCAADVHVERKIEVDRGFVAAPRSASDEFTDFVAASASPADAGSTEMAGLPAPALPTSSSPVASAESAAERAEADTPVATVAGSPLAVAPEPTAEATAVQFDVSGGKGDPLMQPASILEDNPDLAAEPEPAAAEPEPAAAEELEFSDFVAAAAVSTEGDETPGGGVRSDAALSALAELAALELGGSASVEGPSAAALLAAAEDLLEGITSSEPTLASALPEEKAMEAEPTPIVTAPENTAKCFEDFRLTEAKTTAVADDSDFGLSDEQLQDVLGRHGQDVRLTEAKTTAGANDSDFGLSDDQLQDVLGRHAQDTAIDACADEPAPTGTAPEETAIDACADEPAPLKTGEASNVAVASTLMHGDMPAAEPALGCADEPAHLESAVETGTAVAPTLAHGDTHEDTGG